MSERRRRESNGGGGGNRTRVRKGSYGSFYTLSLLVVYLAVNPLNGKWMDGQPVKLRPTATSVTVGLSRFNDVSSDRLGTGHPGDARLY